MLTFTMRLLVPMRQNLLQRFCKSVPAPPACQARLLSTSEQRLSSRPDDFKASRRPVAAKLTARRPRFKFKRIPYHKFSWQKLIGLGVGIFGTGMGLAALFLYVNAKAFKKAPEDVAVLDEEFRRNVFNTSAAFYDEDIIRGEKRLGITRMRQNLIGHAEGKVLELACGTGTNFQYYNKRRVTEVTAMDLSPKMVEVARRKTSSLAVKNLVVGNSEDLSRFPDKTFDTVVDSFGLCSYENPEKALEEMQRVLKDDGKLLLLEHGVCRKTFKFMARILNNNAKRHATTYGCWWNRDILKLLYEPGTLHTPYFRMRHFRTMFFVVAKKKLSEGEGDTEGESQAAGDIVRA